MASSLGFKGSGWLLWAQTHLRWTDAKWKCVLWSDKLTFPIFLGKHGWRVKRQSIQIVTSTKVKSQHLWWCGGVLVPMASWVTCMSVKAPLMLKGTWRFWSICCHLDDVFYRAVPAYFNKTLPSLILHVLQQRCFVRKECGYWTGLSAECC